MKKRKFLCCECDKTFNSWQARDKHQAKAHPEPKTFVEQIEIFNDPHRLKIAGRLKLGDKIAFNKKGIITKIKRTEGETIAEVEIAVLENTWNEAKN